MAPQLFWLFSAVLAAQVCTTGIAALATTATTTTPVTVTGGSSNVIRTAACPRGQGVVGVGAACSPCPTGRYSEAGQPCRPFLGYALAGLGPPRLNATSVAGGVARFEVVVSELPTEFFENATVSYSADLGMDTGVGMGVGGDEGNLSVSVSVPPHCGDGLWTLNPPLLTATVSYSELTGRCRLKASMNETCLIRAGYIGLFVVVNAAEVVRTWLLPIELCFPRAIAGVYKVPLSVRVPTVLRGKSVVIQDFPPGLTLFEVGFQEQRPVPRFQQGDHLYIQIELQGVDKEVGIEEVWLSNSSDPAVEEEHILTGSIVPVESSPGRVRFIATAATCSPCFLHVLGMISLGDGLPPGTLDRVYAVQTVPIEVLAASVQTPQPEQKPVAATTQLILPLWLSLTLVTSATLVASAVSLMLVRKLARAGGDATLRVSMSVGKFAAIELCDFVFDVIAYAFCKSAGDLEFADDEGVIGMLLLVSTACSGLAFLGEMALFLSGHVDSKPLLPWLIMAHFMGEDFLQLSTYALVAACQAASGLEDWGALLLAFSQAVLFLVVKTIDVTGMLVLPRRDYAAGIAYDF